MNKPDKQTIESATIAHPPGFRFRRGQNWFMLGLTYASYYMCRYNIYIVAPRIIEQFGFSKEQFGWIYTARDWSYAVGQFINGLFTDRLGGKQAMAIGAALTIVFNVLFGMASFAGAGSVFVLFMLIRASDGYSQAFGAPGMVKVNTAWFPRSERGRFAGIFGLMIQFGNIAINNLGPLLLAGAAIPLGVVTLNLPAMHWRQHLHIFHGIQPELARNAVADNIHQHFGSALRVFLCEQEKVMRVIGRRGHLTLIDPVRVLYDKATRFLTEDYFQARHRNRPASNHVAQHVTGSH
ncbi:MAG: MFS transporter, partial [Planctomycetes bacterium]|nr:MFS transporter [Planctomycetota bacterium]